MFIVIFCLSVISLIALGEVIRNGSRELCFAMVAIIVIIAVFALTIAYYDHQRLMELLDHGKN